jgi:hypothetical protein
VVALLRRGEKEMNSDLFAGEMKKILYHRLPMSGEYQPSRRIEGWMETSEEKRAFKMVALIIDMEIEPAVREYILDNLEQFFRRDRILRCSKFAVLPWADGKLDEELIRQHDCGIRMSSVRELIKNCSPAECKNGGLEQLTDYYPKFRHIEQIIILTTKEKTEELKELPLFPYGRKSIVTYPKEADGMNSREEYFGQICLGLDVETDEQGNVLPF